MLSRAGQGLGQSMKPAFPNTICFDAYVLDLMRCTLTRGEDEIQLRPKAFDALRYLAEHAGRVVSKDELLGAVWPDVVVTEDSLVQCISDIREALSDHTHRIIKTVPRRGYLFTAELSVRPLEKRAPAGHAADQEITFCVTTDGVNLAVARVGRGVPLVCIPTWASHLEYDWESPTRSGLWQFLADRFDLIRYDGRGFGLSDRNVAEISFATLQRDLETVVDALALRHCALFAISQGCAPAITYAAQYPERVSKVVLHGGFALGRNRRGSANEAELAKAFIAIMREGWGGEDSALLRMFSSSWLPGASPDHIRWFANLLRTSTSAENAIRNRQASDDIDVVDFLPMVRAPTLVLHCRHDCSVPFNEGRRLAASIPSARLVSLESENHVPLPHEPAWPQFLQAIETFLSEG
jgi:DNA-binding winged helix-turn-helix (wHTH) protein/pimeloyl-ACP methyl ester carboxylesterase